MMNIRFAPKALAVAVMAGGVALGAGAPPVLADPRHG